VNTGRRDLPCWEGCEAGWTWELVRCGDSGERTKLIYILDGHLDGLMAMDMLNRKSTGPQFKSIVTGTKKKVDKHDEEEVEEHNVEASRTSKLVNRLRCLSSGTELGASAKLSEGKWRQENNRGPRPSLPPPPPT